jgi:type II secretory ATPase GspE/PulE/Tfp pilus assembly ATPase PilB-like protein
MTGELRPYEPAFSARWKLVLLGEDAREAVVGCAEYPPHWLLSLLSMSHPGKRLKLKRLPQSRLFSALDGGSGWSKPDEGPLGRSETASGLGVRAVDLGDLACELPVVRLLSRLLAEAVEREATDVHLEYSSDGAFACRIRVAGRLEAPRLLERELAVGVFARLRYLAGLDLGDILHPQEGAFELRFEGRDLPVRVSLLPTFRGESAALRLFGQGRKARALSELGFEPEMINRLMRIDTEEGGLLVGLGPTGCGKSTTLRALAAHWAVYRRLVSLEDPVEETIPAAVQLNLREHGGLSSDKALGLALRHDPDIIFLGEIRDPTTAGLAVQAATTGHFMLASIHAQSVDHLPVRLSALGVSTDLLAGVPLYMLSQRLTRGSAGSVHAEGRLEEFSRAFVGLGRAH